jgi:hypothetical protein
MLFSANLFCDFDINNQTGDPVIVSVEGITKEIPVGGKAIFKVELKEGKSLDGISFGRRDTMVKWVRLVDGIFPIVYRSKMIPVPKSLFLLPEGGSYLYWWWWGLEGAGIATEVKGLVADEITDKYDSQIISLRNKLMEGLSAYKNKSYAADIKRIKPQIQSLYSDLAKIEVR